MARVTGQPARVTGRIHLWESCGFGDVLLVAPRAQNSSIRQHWLECGRVFRMFGQWSMACFAIHVRVHTVALGIRNIAVARLAYLVPGIVDRARRNLLNRRPTIMPILTKCLGNQQAANNEEADDTNQEYASEAEEVP